MKHRRCLMIGLTSALAGVLLLAGVALAQNQGGGPAGSGQPGVYRRPGRDLRGDPGPQTRQPELSRLRRRPIPETEGDGRDPGAAANPVSPLPRPTLRRPPSKADPAKPFPAAAGPKGDGA